MLYSVLARLGVSQLDVCVHMQWLGEHLRWYTDRVLATRECVHVYMRRDPSQRHPVSPTRRLLEVGAEDAWTSD